MFQIDDARVRVLSTQFSLDPGAVRECFAGKLQDRLAGKVAAKLQVGLLLVDLRLAVVSRTLLSRFCLRAVRCALL